MSETIHVFCGIDSHIPNLKGAINSAQEIFPDDAIAVGNFYSDTKQKKLKEFCLEQKIPFTEKGQPFFNGSGHRICASEIIGMIQLSKSFYDQGFSEVFLLHADTLIYRDYKPFFRACMNGKWSAICPLINFLNPAQDIKRLWSKVKSLNSKQIENSSPARLTQSAVIFNPHFISSVYNQYDEETLGDYFSTYWSNSSTYGDCALFDLNHMDFKIQPLLEAVSLERSWIQPHVSIESLLEKLPTFTYIHEGSAYDPN